jgi:hypothetical protein
MIENEITLPISIRHNDEDYSGEITCSVLPTSNTDLIIGLPTMACEFYELTISLLHEAREIFNGGNPDGENNLNAVIRSVPYHGFDGVAIEPFSNPVKVIAPEETGKFDHCPDSFPGLLDVMDAPAEEKFKEFKEEQVTRVNPNLPEKHRQLIILELDEFFDVFNQTNFDGVRYTTAIELEVSPDMPKEHRPPHRYISYKDKAAFDAEVERMKKSMYVVSISSVVHGIVVAAKKTAPFIRICGDYRFINLFILKPHWPIPSVKDAMRILRNGNVYGEADLAHSFHQLPLSLKAQELLSVSIPGHGTFKPTKMPEGVSSASEHLQRIMTEIFNDFIQAEWLLVIFDNLVVIAQDIEDLLAKTRLFLTRCREYNLFLKFKKCTWGYSEIDFFGYRVSKKGYYLLDEKVQALDNWQFPRNTKKMQSFLGFTLFFSPFIPAYSEKAAYLYECVHKDFDWRDQSKWKRDYFKLFEDFKEMLKQTYLICFPDYSLDWELFTDASDLGVAGVLFQVNPQEDGTKRLEVIAFVSQKFSDVALRWSTIEKECYAIFYTLKTLHRMLSGKEFVCYTDHANLRQLEKSDVPKLQRWASYLATFDMKIIHIPGSKNPSDAGSRSFGDILPASIEVLAEWRNNEGVVVDSSTASSSAYDSYNKGIIDTDVLFSPNNVQILNLANAREEEGESTAVVSSDVISPDSVFDAVHNSKVGHWGVQRTYSMANKYFPGHNLSIKYFQNKISTCPLCQKYRTGLTSTLEPMTLHMKVQTRRAAIGADVLKVMPDKEGYIGLLVIVTMSTKLASLHPIKDESSSTLARELFQFYARYGLYELISVDPGSNISQAVVEELNNLLGVRMKVSLVDRHESNGAEGTNAQVLRHIRMLVQDSRAKDNWSDPTYLACCQLILNSHVNAESSDQYTPFELTFGSEAAPFYTSISDKLLSMDVKDRSPFIKQLNEHLRLVWEITKIYQQSILAKRIPDQKSFNRFQAGDLVLHLESKRPTKLDSEFSGPYSVISHSSNTVECRHLSSGVVKFLHVSRLKPFFGTDTEAYDLAVRDKDQFEIKSILTYRGDPDKRQTMEFQVQFSDGDIRWLPWSKDLFDSIPYELFCRQHSHLFPLLFTVETAKKEIKKLSKQEIRNYHVGDKILVNLRSFGELWYQELPLPEVNTTRYGVPYVVKNISKDLKSVVIDSTIYKGEIKVDSYYLFAYVLDPSTPFVEVSPELLRQFPVLQA